MKIEEPRIKEVFEKDFFENLEDCENGLFENVKSDSEIVLDSISMEGCIFKKCDFQNINLKNVSFLDVIFENCDLSNQRFSKKSFGRVVFEIVN